MKIKKIMKRMKIKVKINEIPKWIQSRTVPGWRGAHYGNRFCRQLRLSAAVAFTIWTNCGARHLEPWNLWDLSDSAKDYTHICHIYVTYMMKWMCIFVCVSFLFKTSADRNVSVSIYWRSAESVHQIILDSEHAKGLHKPGITSSRCSEWSQGKRFTDLTAVSVC